MTPAADVELGRKPLLTSLPTSGAQVRFHVGSALIQTFFVPSNACAVLGWNGSSLKVLGQLY